MRKIGQILKITKTTYYYQINKCSTVDVNNYEQEVISAFNENRKIYGAPKIKAILTRKDILSYSEEKFAKLWLKIEPVQNSVSLSN